MPYEFIIYEKKDRIAYITFNRPERMNALIGTAEENAETMRRVLSGETGPVRDVVLLNAAAGLLAAGRTDDLRDGVRQAAEAIDSGAATRVMETYVSVSRSFSA